MAKQFTLTVPARTIFNLLEHFGPDPVTRGWCHEADFSNQSHLWVVEVLDESKEPTKGNLKRHRLTSKALAAGLQAMAGMYPQRVGDVLDDDQHDAPLADLFVQCCLFGEEKYC